MPRSWLDDPPPFPQAIAPEDGYRVRGLWIPAQAVAAPTGESWPAYSPYRERLLCLLEEYAAICELAGEQFPILHGYRVDEHPHADGRCLDIGPVPGISIPMMAALARTRRDQPASKLMGIGTMPAWLHLDIRPRQKRAVWWTINPDRAW